MKVIYSIGSKLGGHGIGGQAVRAVQGILRARALKKVLASYTTKTLIPKKFISHMGPVGRILRRLAYYDPTGYGYVLHDSVFDRWAAEQLDSCDLFHGWNHHCLYQLRGIKGLKGIKRETITVVERASSHILQGQQIIREEYRKYGVKGSFWPDMYVEKCLKEYQDADYILVPSEYAQRSFIERGFDESRIVKLAFGVDRNKFKVQSSKLKTTSKISKLDKFIVLFVGEVRLGKGVQYLLEAWDKLGLNDAELWLVGEVKGDLRTVLSKYRNRNDIKFLGFRKDVPELMAQASVFAFPSLDEGSALVTYEAMAAGLPVVTTPNAGSLVRDSLDGYIVPIKDSDSLAERIEYFYKYLPKAEALGESGRERIKPFSWERYGENLVKSYIRMLK